MSVGVMIHPTADPVSSADRLVHILAGASGRGVRITFKPVTRLGGSWVYYVEGGTAHRAHIISAAPTDNTYLGPVAGVKYISLSNAEVVTWAAEAGLAGHTRIRWRLFGRDGGGSFQTQVDYAGDGNWIDVGAPISTQTAETDIELEEEVELPSPLLATSKIRAMGVSTPTALVCYPVAYTPNELPGPEDHMVILDTVPMAKTSGSVELAVALAPAGQTLRFSGGYYHNDESSDPDFVVSTATWVVNGATWTPAGGYYPKLQSLNQSGSIYYNVTYSDIGDFAEVYTFSGEKVAYESTLTASQTWDIGTKYIGGFQKDPDNDEAILYLPDGRVIDLSTQPDGDVADSAGMQSMAVRGGMADIYVRSTALQWDYGSGETWTDYTPSIWYAVNHWRYKNAASHQLDNGEALRSRYTWEFLGPQTHTLFSDDDGLTWHNPLDPEIRSVTGRVTRFVDYGDATRLLVGSGCHLRIGWFDLSALECGTFCRFQSSWNNANASMLFQHSGVWYWGSSDSDSGDGNTPVIRVSTDLVNWVTYWRPTRTDVRGIPQYVGELAGKLHFRVYDADTSSSAIDEHVVLDPARVVKRRGVLTSPAKQNLLGDRPSMCDRLSDWELEQNSGGTYSVVEIDTDNAFVPGAIGSLHLVKNDRQYDEHTGVVAVATTTIEVGKRYQAHAWAKGRGFAVNASCTSDQGESDRIDYAINADWTEIWGKPFTAGDTETQFRLLLTQHRADRSSELWLGAAEIVECPVGGEWTPGGVAQPAEVLSAELDYESHWTHLFSFMSLQDTPELTNGTSDPVYLRSWVAPGGDFISLYFDPSDGKIKLESTVDSTPTGSPIETSSTRRIEREHLIRIAVRYAAGEVSFSVSDGAAVEHVGPLTHAGDALSGEDITAITGDDSGEGVMSGILLDDYVLPLCLSDQHVADIFDEPGNFESAFTPETALQLV